jgi:hypothetical protein
MAIKHLIVSDHSECETHPTNVDCGLLGCDDLCLVCGYQRFRGT